MTDLALPRSRSRHCRARRITSPLSSPLQVELDTLRRDHLTLLHDEARLRADLAKTYELPRRVRAAERARDEAAARAVGGWVPRRTSDDDDRERTVAAISWGGYSLFSLRVVADAGTRQTSDLSLFLLFFLLCATPSCPSLIDHRSLEAVREDQRMVTSPEKSPGGGVSVGKVCGCHTLLLA